MYVFAGCTSSCTYSTWHRLRALPVAFKYSHTASDDHKRAYTFACGARTFVYTLIHLYLVWVFVQVCLRLWFCMSVGGFVFRFRWIVPS